VNQVNVHDDGSKQNEPERDKASDDQEQAANDLEYGDNVKVMTQKKSLREVTEESQRWRRHRNKMQEDVRTEYDENEPEKNPSDNRGNFHAGIVR
jgi:hypothetical protein